MSILEIILYSLLGTATLTYIIVTIVKWNKKKKNKAKEEDEEI